jgi:hypothetical protein
VWKRAYSEMLLAYTVITEPSPGSVRSGCGETWVLVLPKVQARQRPNRSYKSCVSKTSKVAQLLKECGC